jgi:hypothetical protein
MEKNRVLSEMALEVGSFSYRGARETLGTRFDLLLVSGSGKRGAYQRPVGVSSVMRCGEPRKGSLAVKPRAKCKFNEVAEREESDDGWSSRWVAGGDSPQFWGNVGGKGGSFGAEGFL